MAPPAHLRAVPDANGEVHDVESLRAELARKDAVIKGLNRDINGWRIRYRQLEEDKAAEAREHVLWPVGKHLFDGWRRACDHPRSKWTEDRFWCVEPFLVLPRYHATLEGRVGLCCRAIIGARYDCWKVQRRNGDTKRFDEWSRIFGSSDAFEDFCSRSPKGWRPTLTEPLRALIVECERVLERQAEAARLERKQARESAR